jgi:osmotically-inducible protein OsmY
MADNDRYRGRNEDRDVAGPRREQQRFQGTGRGGGGREFGGEGAGGSSGREAREGFWGRGHHDSGFHREDRQDYSREDYGATDRGPDQERRPDAGNSGRGRQETGSGRGYGGARDDVGQEASGQSFAGNEGRGFGYGSDYRGAYGGGGYGGDDRGREGYGNRGGGRERGLFERATDEVSSWFGDRDAERRRQEDHRGRGPKGYKRSDSRIEEDINDRLYDDSHVDASDITVSVSAGEVTLSGRVASRDARRRAEDIAEQVSGVTYVQNNLRVGTGDASSSSTAAPTGSAS